MASNNVLKGSGKPDVKAILALCKRQVEGCSKCHGTGTYLKEELPDDCDKYEGSCPRHLYRYGCESCRSLRELFGMDIFTNEKKYGNYSLYGGTQETYERANGRKDPHA